LLASVPEGDGARGLSSMVYLEMTILYALKGRFEKAQELLQLSERAEATAAKEAGGKNKSQLVGVGASGVQCIKDYLAREDRAELAHGLHVPLRCFPPLCDAAEAKPVAWHPTEGTDHDGAEGADGAADPIFSQPQPVRVELGSGHGDWIVAKAAAEPQAHWVAVELRHDRASMIRAKANMAGLRNLCVLAGDAHGILQHFLPTRTVSEVFCNFPQPPQWDGTEQHLVNSLFLQEVWRILQPGTALTIATDDKAYCHHIVGCLTKRPENQARWSPCFGDPFFKHFTKGLKGYGSSVFDSIWTSRGFEDRFLIRYHSKGSQKKKRKRGEGSKRQKKKKKKKTAGGAGNSEEEEEEEESA